MASLGMFLALSPVGSFPATKEVQYPRLQKRRSAKEVKVAVGWGGDVSSVKSVWKGGGGELSWFWGRNSAAQFRDNALADPGSNRAK
jgi:hypothetical protein